MKINTDLNSRTIQTRIAIGDAILDELEKKRVYKDQGIRCDQERQSVKDVFLPLL